MAVLSSSFSVFIVLGIYNLGIIFAAVEKLVRPPSPPRHEIVTTMGKVANIRHCVTTTGFHIGVKLFVKSPLLRFSLFNFFDIKSSLLNLVLNEWTKYKTLFRLVIIRPIYIQLKTNPTQYWALNCSKEFFISLIILSLRI